MERVLLIDDDERLAAMLVTYLEARGLKVDHRRDAATGVPAARNGGYDALLLDVMLPDGDGFDLCRQIRATSTVPILMLTARGDETDRIVGLELGADDYLPKPFNPRELLARLRAVLRRATPAPRTDALHFGRLVLDRERRQVLVDGEVRPLTQHQFDLLVALASSPGRVLSRAQLMERVRGEELEAFDRSIDVHISRIRSAIEEDPAKPRRILTLRGAGYLFVANPE